MVSQTEILKQIDSIVVKDNDSNLNWITNLSTVGKVNKNKISSNKIIFIFKTNMKKIIKTIMYVIYKIIKKPLNIFLRIVDPSIYQSGQEIEMLRNENRLLKQKLLDAK